MLGYALPISEKERKALLSVENLQVRYGSIVALRGISVEVKAGEIVSVIGPNGAGKSTLLHAIMGSVAATVGSIFF
jgi:branched-chain amino acid transport system ATP-binding protein